MTPTPILEVIHLGLRLGNKSILNNLSMEFWPGYVHAVIGPNGAGKSTLASTIMGLSGYTHFTGDIVFEGKSIKRLSIDQRAKMGITLAWQEPARYEGLSIQSFIQAGAKDKSSEKAREALELVGLDPDSYMTRAVDATLSGGERKRIELASLLNMRPKLVIMDEPDSGIDVDALNRIFEAIRALKKNGSTVLLITHSLTVLKQADHGFLICCGKLLEKGSIEKLEAFFGDKCIPCDHKNEPVLESING
jgi:Fe-S cluster assembly ATP-binding protein